MPADERMYFIQNMEALKDEDVDSIVFEFEVIADAHIVGECTYGPYYFTVWEPPKSEGEERKLCLRVPHKVGFWGDESNRGSFYHGGGIADELVALASLFFRRRFKLGPIVRINDEPRYITKDGQRFIDSPLISGSSNLQELSNWLKLVERLNSKYHQKFILAVRFYHQALLLIEEQPDLAYLNLVSAIESLCQDTDIGEVRLSELDEGLAKLVNSIENENLRNKIEQAILKRERFHKRKFVTFILNHMEESFWTEEGRPEVGRIRPEDLPDILKRIYDQRSRTLHNGEPFPPTVFSPPTYYEEEIPFSLSVTHMGRKWERKEFIPHPHFFERLVNHVLKTFLKRNQTEGQ